MRLIGGDVQHLQHAAHLLNRQLTVAVAVELAEELSEYKLLVMLITSELDQITAHCVDESLDVARVHLGLDRLAHGPGILNELDELAVLEAAHRNVSVEQAEVGARDGSLVISAVDLDGLAPLVESLERKGRLSLRNREAFSAARDLVKCLVDDFLSSTFKWYSEVSNPIGVLDQPVSIVGAGVVCFHEALDLNDREEHTMSAN